MNTRLIALSAIAALASAAHAQTGYTITGSQSNFDCTNRCDYDCDEMEIEIEGIHPEDVLHTYHNGNYGAPSVTLSADGNSTIIDYRNPGHRTSVGSIEHFGYTVRGAIYYGPQPYHPTKLHWYRDGHIATVNGQLPVGPGGGTVPATQPLQPTISASVTAGSHGTGGVSLTVTNNDPNQIIWIKRSAQVTTAPVTLEALMPDNPLVTTSVALDSGPLRVDPLSSVTDNKDFFEIEESQSVVFSARYFQNVVADDPFASNHDTPGPEIGNIMTATLADPDRACDHSMPTILEQPLSVTADTGARIDLRVRGHGDDVSPLTYVWMKEGTPITDGADFTGTDSAHLRIKSLKPATEGFYSVQITNTCKTILSDAALVFITGHNVAPTHVTPPACVADFDGSGGTPDASDIDAYFVAWLAGSPSADSDGSGGTPDATDIDLFFTQWLAGGC